MGREVLVTKREELVLSGRRSSRTHDNGGHCLPTAFCEYRQDAGIGDRWMARQYPFHFRRVDRLAIGEESVRDPVDDPDKPLVIDARGVARAEPAT